MLPVQRGDRLPHLISPDEVADWLTDSVNRRVTYHNTSLSAATEIRQNGVWIDRSRLGSFGQGFYTGTVPEPFYGPVSVPVAIRLLRPLVGHLNEVEAYIEDVIVRLRPRSPAITPPLAGRIRRELLDAGYDGLMIGDAGGDGINFVVALVDGVTRVVTEG